ncbi:MAG: hypothetical protein CGU28_08305 [Candidatus Dactylopiibacterium carminicum]|uniref:ABC transporter substrate-binding protein n=1 Tax=Candidatus Dactylopiibacterium carminicum TaxID=857335 RepID=A0A272ESA8_9RHOO|nr:ABC transporter substrate-binding protein [Candidatus Dactylopiibacterium carminicum]KAF7600672.1 ABC transporter substrate-binding protein [Candidatus Dactylopiibacterium carminicum]PAS92975.1 MAG: hypothetical protein CGU29_09325 [Candidatus Dactylopiibacterium carminicum]PAS96522.1 MAG: hypothetical protein CGU28_08305 [Candidatus Dactylopiibacterium carminicum]PAT00674.1 MAG: hypothetical protein BSR46_00735 [Candidatus Dactylopiibacterium carminicum]
MSTPLWFTRCPLPTAFSLAVHSGILARHLAAFGVAPQSLRHVADASFRLAHFTHALPDMTRQGGHIPPLWSRAAGRDVRLLGLSWTDERQLLLVERDDIQDVADLKGKRLALPVRPNYPIDFWRATVLKGYHDLLATVGLSLDDVTLVEIPIDAAAFAERASRPDLLSPPGAARQTLSSQTREGRALLAGSVDAIYSPAHYGIALQQVLGLRVLADLTRSHPPEARINNSSLLALTVSGEFLRDHSDAVTALLTALLEAAELARTTREMAIRITAAESGNAEELVPDIFGEHFHQVLAPSLAPALLQALAGQNEFLHRHGFIDRVVPLEEWLAPEPLATAQSRLAEVRAA